MNIPHIKEPDTIAHASMSMEEYVEFCAFCRKGNSKLTPENCMTIRTDEMEIKVPFRLDI